MWSGWTGGAITWFIPFAISCLVIKPDENGNIIRLLDEDTFRTLMLLCGSSASAFSVYKCFPKTLKAGTLLALQFLIVNWVLDLLILVPLMTQEKIGQKKLTFDAWSDTVPHWFRSIGAGYIGFVLICPLAGAIAERTTRQINSKVE